jgi:hypothetical protein
MGREGLHVADMASPARLRRPLRDLLALLPLLPTTEGGEPDYAEADPDLLVRLAESAELVLQIVHDGLPPPLRLV